MCESKKSYVSPEGKQFYGLPNVERFLANTDLCSGCIGGKDRRKGHSGPCVTFVLPNNWKTVNMLFSKLEINNGRKSHPTFDKDCPKFIVCSNIFDSKLPSSMTGNKFSILINK